MAAWAWTPLLVPAGIAAAALLPRAEAGPSLGAGAFLVGLDLVVENAGAMLGWWTTTGGLFRIGVTPVEVLVLAFMAGACLGPAVKRWPGPSWTLVGGLAVGGAAIEVGLIEAGLMTYAGLWNPVLAFLAYVAALSATLAVHRALARGARIAGPSRVAD